MSVTVEGKLELFKKILFEHVEEDWSQRKQQLAEAMEQKLNEEKKEYEKQIKFVMEDAKRRAEAKRKNILAIAQGDKDEEITSKKEELFKDLNESLKAWAREFIKSGKYKEFLSNNLDQALGLMEGKRLVLILTKRDMDELSSFIKDKIAEKEGKRNIELMETKEDIIGGFIMEDREMGIIADFSIKALADEAKVFMGKLLYERLDEVLKA
ncbi:V-type ATP synthase subunit E [Lutispora thermophila]|uniref:H+-ATPase subunit E/Vma4 n=1 Tax=Lutispora thermophila DSM 19022 TaxID=1122184 RepID=A0A1M6E878_9FIRM|nr:V-type ATP synthase subunit E family protein [Lutispora thermophila]SHI81706.1 H+-ATPase subunit E/Vma4 [Lutispora thermophila DSM 19022]